MREFLDRQGVDAVIIADPYNMRHISGFSGGEGYVYVSRDKKIIITDSRYTEATTKEAKQGFEVIESSVTKSDIEIIKDLSISDNAKCIGFEDLFLTCALYGRIIGTCGFESMKPLAESVNDLRIIKEPWEIDNLRMAESIGDKAFLDILNYIKPGVTELQIAAELEYSMKKHGAERLSFDSIVASGANSSLPHAVPSAKVVCEGDFLTMDFGCTYNGYCSDMTRTVVVGNASDKQREIYDTVLKAQLEAMKAIHSGVIGKDIHNIAAGVIAAAGYGSYFGHGLGHSVGLYIHENPRFSAVENRAIMAGTIETVEPGIYIPDFGGVRIEDMIVVTEDGYDNLTHSPKELIEIK
jgi:Xaa-Pro aminopeptidase